METLVPDPTPVLEQDPYVTGVDDPYDIVTGVDDPYVDYPYDTRLSDIYEPVSRNNIGLILQTRVTCTGTSDLPDGGAQADKILQGGWLESHCHMACKVIGFAIICLFRGGSRGGSGVATPPPPPPPNDFE